MTIYDQEICKVKFACSVRIQESASVSVAGLCRSHSSKGGSWASARASSRGAGRNTWLAEVLQPIRYWDLRACPKRERSWAWCKPLLAFCQEGWNPAAIIPHWTVTKKSILGQAVKNNTVGKRDTEQPNLVEDVICPLSKMMCIFYFC